MKVPPEKIKARLARFQKEGLKVQATLDLNAGIKELRSQQYKRSQAPRLSARKA
jgi:hypothetical protein